MKTAKKFLAVLMCAAMLFGSAGILSAFACESCGMHSKSAGVLDFWIEDDDYFEMDLGAYVTECDETVSGTVEIPSQVDGIPVVGIYETAFNNCKDLTDVIIPDSVTYVSRNAFEGTKLYNDESNWENGILYIDTILADVKEDIAGVCNIKNGTKIIAASAFEGCHSLESVTVPDGVKIIHQSTFEDCGNLKTVVLPESVTVIKNHAFASCISLEEINFPSGLSTIGQAAFSGCETLTDVKLSAVTAIEMQAFENCYSLENVDLGSKLQRIEANAFVLCASIPSIVIPDTVEKIGRSAFAQCYSLGDVSMSKGIKRICPDAFSEAKCYSDGNWDGDVLYIGNAAIDTSPFIDKECRIKEGTTIIAEEAFEECSELETVILPSSLKYINSSAFSSDVNLKNVQISSGLKELGDKAFDECTALEKISVDPANTAFKSDENGVLYSKDGAQLIKYPAGKTDAEFGISEGVEKICKDAFRACAALKRVEFPGSLREIDDSAFFDCQQLDDVKLPNGIVRIGDWAFGGCHEIKSITLPKSVSELSETAFSYCLGLESLTVDPENSSYCSDDDGVVYTKDMTKLVVYPRGSKLTKYSVPDGVISINTNILYSNLEILSLPTSFEGTDGSDTEKPENLKIIYFRGSKEQWERIPLSTPVSVICRRGIPKTQVMLKLDLAYVKIKASIEEIRQKIKDFFRSDSICSLPEPIEE